MAQQTSADLDRQIETFIETVMRAAQNYTTWRANDETDQPSLEMSRHLQRLAAQQLRDLLRPF